MELAPKVDVLEDLRDPKRAVDVANPCMLLEALTYQGAPPAPIWHEREKARGELGDGLAVKPVVAPKEAGSPVSKVLGCGGAEEVRRPIIH